MVGESSLQNGARKREGKWGVIAFAASALVAGASFAGAAVRDQGVPRIWKPLLEFANPEGRVAVATVGGPVDPATHPFFAPIGVNGRACVTCHEPANAMSLSTATIRAAWEKQGPASPLFAAIDGSNCPTLPQEKQSSHSLLLERGVFRIARPWPPRDANGKRIDPEFTIRVLSDPTGCNTDPRFGLNSADPHISVFRRPRMAANLRYILRPMHENNTKTMAPLDRDPETGEHVSMSLLSDARLPSLRTQMQDAAHTHMEMLQGLSPEQMRRIEDFELRVYVAQTYSKQGGSLEGGPKALGVAAMRDGRDHINGNDRDTGVFFTFDQWKLKPGQKPRDAQQAFRASVARGNDIFFNRGFWISGVVGMNNIRLGNPYKQTCAFCHNTQLTGHDDVPGWMDLGTQNFPAAPPNGDLPVFEIVCKPKAAPHPYLGRRIYTNDPGRALVSGKCMDVGGMVMQQFRGMAARAPYFSNGSARTIRDVVDFYERRFNIGFTEQEKVDLTNFLSVL
jgi:hypothetical protein